MNHIGRWVDRRYGHFPHVELQSSSKLGLGIVVVVVIVVVLVVVVVVVVHQGQGMAQHVVNEHAPNPYTSITKRGCSVM